MSNGGKKRHKGYPDLEKNIAGKNRRGALKTGMDGQVDNERAVRAKKRGAVTNRKRTKIQNEKKKSLGTGKK